MNAELWAVVWAAIVEANSEWCQKYGAAQISRTRMDHLAEAVTTAVQARYAIEDDT